MSLRWKCKQFSSIASLGRIIDQGEDAFEGLQVFILDGRQHLQSATTRQASASEPRCACGPSEHVKTLLIIDMPYCAVTQSHKRHL